MATFDVADLLARCKRLRRRPATDEGTSDADWYAQLTEAEAIWKPVIAQHYPNDMYSAPALMTTSDGGYTYVLPSSQVDPLQMIVLSSATGDLLKPGAYWDRGADYVHEGGGRIRMTAGRSRTFADGPYARYVTGPIAIAAGVDSSIEPDRLRLLLVYAACEIDASRGGADDPSYYRAMLQKAAFGDPLIPGDTGLIGSLKARNAVGGLAAYSGGRPYSPYRPNG